MGNRAVLSQTPCWKRIQKLEASGVITGQVARVDPIQIGFGLTVFVKIEAPDHSADWRETFTSVVSAMPEVMEVYRMAGEIDYLLRVAVRDSAAFDAFYRKLTDAVAIKNITSQFAMERIRHTASYPIDTHNH